MNKVTKRVFSDIIEATSTRGGYEEFLSVDEKMGIPETPTLKDMKEEYERLASDCVGDVRLLALVEEIIIQIRCMTPAVVHKELRLSLSRDYLYARSTFYRHGHKMNDLRVVVGKTDEYGSEIEKLIKDPQFRMVCFNKLREAMETIVDQNIKNLTFIYNGKSIENNRS